MSERQTEQRAALTAQQPPRTGGDGSQTDDGRQGNARLTDARLLQRQTLASQYPDFEPLTVAQVVLPVWILKFDAEVLAQSELSKMALYTLSAIHVGWRTAATIAANLGIDERDLAVPAVELLKYQLIEQGALQGSQWGSARLLTLTPRGREALQHLGKLPVPKRRSYRLQLNALTGALEGPDATAWSNERLIREGLFVLPVETTAEPTLGALPRDEVARALRGERSFTGFDLVEVLALRPPQRAYLPWYTLYLLCHRRSGEERLALFRQSQFLAAESAVLQRLYANGVRVLPADAAQVAPPLPPIPASLPTRQAEAVREANDRVQALEERVQHLSQLLAAEREEYAIAAAAAHATRADADRVEQAEAELARVRSELATAETRLTQTLATGQVQYLRTEDHRPKLEQALREAQREIVIISPWFTRRAVNLALRQLLVGALRRGVVVRIGYGMGQEHDRQEADRHANNLNAVLWDLRESIPPDLEAGLELWRTTGTHQKILVCDRTWAVNTSFNWLSYLGAVDEGYRNETGMLVHNPQDVAGLAAEAERVLSTATRTPLRLPPAPR